MKYAAVTTFSPHGYEQYGRRFLESYVKHWPKDVPIYVYHEGHTVEAFVSGNPSCGLPSISSNGYDPKNEFLTDPRIHWINLSDDKDRAAFMGRHKDDSKDYRFQIVRFAHKIWALTDPNRIETVDTENWIWLDADIETLDTVDEEFLSNVCPAGFRGSYLGRVDWHHSECGFVSYSRDHGGIAFLSELREIYKSDKILEFDEHHDSFIFDKIKKGWWYNISDGVRGMHVFDDSILGKKMKHYKGPLRKAGKIKGDGNYLSKAEKAELKDKYADVLIGKQPLIVKTKNCVKDKNISANIHYFATLVDRYIVECEPNDGVIIFCSGGPSLKNYLQEIKKLRRRKNHYVICVKSAHDYLIENNVIPYACILLDPRPHVVDFIETPHPEVNYLVASMVHPVAIDQLLKKNAKVWGYHAMVGAGEDEVIKMRCGGRSFMLAGGCSTAMRGVSVLYNLGFRKYRLYGYDLCYEGDVDMTAKDDKGRDKYFEVEVLGRKFITDAEKVAQAQDFSQMMKEKSIQMEVFGPGLVPHIWNTKRKILPRFEDVFK